jgi:3-oxoacyl-[acyl-carrier protein] reductase
MGEPRTILVTGATGGIGRAVCERLAGAGCSLILAARDETRLRSLGRELADAGPGPCSWIAVDMASDQSVEAFAREITARGVALDGAVLMPPQPHATSDPLPASDAWREIFQASFVGPLGLLKAAIAAMRPDAARTAGGARSSSSRGCRRPRCWATTRPAT